MDALIVVDMQAGLRNGEPKHDLGAIIERINRLAADIRQRAGTVIFVQHCGGKGDDFEPETPGWALLPELHRDPSDVVVQKTLNDPFAGTGLAARLNELAPDRVLITGWATDFCVDATVRSAVSNDHHVVVVSNAHTLNDRPHLDAVSVIRHHHWVWSQLITRRSIRLARTDELLISEHGQPRSTGRIGARHPARHSLKRDEIWMNRRRAPGVSLRKPLHTSPDHALGSVQHAHRRGTEGRHSWDFSAGC